jgi:hypothetical protein
MILMFTDIKYSSMACGLLIVIPFLTDKLRMEVLKSTAENPLWWKWWQMCNYSVAGSAFLVGSVLFFPPFASTKVISAVSAWAFTIGSLGYIIGDSI